MVTLLRLDFELWTLNFPARLFPMLSRKPWLPEVVMMFIGAIVLGACVTNLAALALHSAHVPGFRQPDDKIGRAHV